MLTTTGLEARGGSIFQDTAKPEQIIDIIAPKRSKIAKGLCLNYVLSLKGNSTIQVFNCPKYGHRHTTTTTTITSNILFLLT